MPLQATSGAASYDAFGGGVPVEPVYIEQIFSTWLYTGTGASQTITNGIDLSTKGGLVWLKCRSNAFNNYLSDTARGITNYVSSNQDQPQNWAATVTDMVASTSTTGFVLGTGSTLNGSNGSGQTQVSWTFRKQPKFFDIVTYTGNGATQNIAHSLAGTVGTLIIKRTDTGGSNWMTYHRSLPADEALALNTTEASSAYFTPTIFGNNTVSVAPTSTQFTVGNFSGVNASGGTYVAYLFAHNAGGFGLTGTDNVISCGSFTCVGNVATVNLGYEPQWIMNKVVDSTGGWLMTDVMRGMPTGGGDNQQLFANTDDAEYAGAGGVGLHPTATGFTVQGFANKTYIYIAIRRGPMKVPTLGTSVFATVARTGTGATASVTAGFPVDMYLMQRRPTASFPNIVDRLRGNTKNIQTYQTDAETTTTDTVTGFDNMTAAIVGADTAGYVNESGITYVNQMFRRAPSFMDVVCYTGTSSTRTVSHNLAAVPQLMITKVRSSAGYGWFVYPLDPTKYMELNSTSGTGVTSSAWNDTAPTASVFTVGPADQTNLSGATMVAYLFATCAGVSKVGSYTGNGSTQTIDCGFGAGGARFVLIKRTDSTGAWYVYDTARGMTTLTDPYLRLNSTGAEVATLGSVTTVSTGFAVNAAILAAINTNAASYIFLAIS